MYVLPPLQRPKRAIESSFLNSVANTTGVREWLGGEGAIDLTPAMSDSTKHRRGLCQRRIRGASHGRMSLRSAFAVLAG